MKGIHTTFVPIILFPNKFKEEPRLNLLIYVYHAQHQVTLFDHNKRKLNNNRMAILCNTLKQTVIKLEQLELLNVAKKAEKEDILLCEQFISYQVFALKVYNTGRLCNSFYSDHFGSGDIFLLRKDEEFLQQACLILSRKHDNNFTKTQFFFIYKMIKEKKKEQKLYFDYYYDFDMGKNPTMLQEWFYQTNPKYCLKFNSETDEFWYSQNAIKKVEDKHLYYLLLDIKEANTYWQNKFRLRQSTRKNSTVKNILQFLQNMLNHQFPTISVCTMSRDSASNTKNLPAVYNSVKWISFFHYQDSSTDQHFHDKHDNAFPFWVEKKIMGFYLLSSLMEHNGHLQYSVANKADICFTRRKLTILQDSLLFYCGYLKDEIKNVFNLRSLPAGPKNTTQNQQTNQNTKSNTSPTVPTSKQPQKTINNQNKNENQKTNQQTKTNTIPVPVSKKPKITKIDQKKTITQVKKSKLGETNLAYARYLIAEKDSSAYKIFKISEQENLSIMQLTEKCKDVGLMVHPKSNANKKDKENENAYRLAFDIARAAAVKLFAGKIKNSTSEIDQEESGI